MTSHAELPFTQREGILSSEISQKWNSFQENSLSLYLSFLLSPQMGFGLTTMLSISISQGEIATPDLTFQLIRQHWCPMNQEALGGADEKKRIWFFPEYVNWRRYCNNPFWNLYYQDVVTPSRHDSLVIILNSLLKLLIIVSLFPLDTAYFSN